MFNNSAVLKGLLVLALIVLSFFSVFVGVRDISITDIHRLSEDDMLVMMVSRIPRLAAILIAGIGMSVSGLIVQQIALNKFVSPTTMGTLDATKLGILMSMLLVPASGIYTKFAFAFFC